MICRWLIAALGGMVALLSGQVATAAEPYRFPIVLPPPLRSPPTDPAAPYTPTVRRILDQLLPGNHPTWERIDVANVGDRAGAEVAQVYVGPGPERPGVQQAVRALRGFARVALAPGERRRIAIDLDPRSFQYWHEQTQAWRTNSGPRAIFVGDADDAAHLPLRAEVRIVGRPDRDARGEKM